MFKDIVEWVNRLCGPAQIYFVFSAWMFVFVLAKMLVSGNFSLSNTVLRLSIIYLVTWVLNWLCVKGWDRFSWFLLYWMFTFVLIMLIGTFVLANKILNKTKIINLNPNQN
jgi:hypothetical protein